MNCQGFGLTDRGMVRAGNEDSMLLDEQIGLFAVADGMGGHKSGEVASRMAVDVLHDYITRVRAGSDSFIGSYDAGFSREANLLASGIRLANRAVFEAAASSPELDGMGTTIVAILVNAGHTGIAHAGDSRLYLHRDRQLRQITADHSVVAEQQRAGIITEEEAASSTKKNIITRALGQWENLDIEIQDLELVDGDRLLLCSDGLNGMVSDAEIAALLNAYPERQAACTALIEVANDYGGRDNVTAVLVDYRQPRGLMAGIHNFFGKG